MYKVLRFFWVVAFAVSLAGCGGPPTATEGETLIDETMESATLVDETGAEPTNTGEPPAE